MKKINFRKHSNIIIISTISAIVITTLFISVSCVLQPKCIFKELTNQKESKIQSSDSEDNTHEFITEISAIQAKELISARTNNPDFIILDIRTPKEFDESHIENAININYYSDTFRNELIKLDKTKTYLVYCRSGSRSGMAMPMFENLGFETIYHMNKGINDWKNQAFPLIQNATAHWTS